MKVVIDIWGGDCHCDHLARFIRPLEEAMQIARNNLFKDYLVNLRTEISWGQKEEFDIRSRPN